MKSRESFPIMDEGVTGPDPEAGRSNEEARTGQQAELREYLKGYLETEDAEAIELVAIDGLPEKYREQYEFVDDERERLRGVTVAVVPKELWPKGLQPSESHAERGLILFSDEYFNEGDPSAWMTHELAHCSRHEDNPDAYFDDMATPAFRDLAGEYAYPNNKVELETFTTQFRYLKEKGVEKIKVHKMLEEQYEPEDMPFLDRVLDGIYDREE
ncbi:MAG: hypothetical protein U9Q03_02315 [Patescibacteria group bacterium]|nr:hypothetical protein [Patescibacteria group bacterium]